MPDPVINDDDREDLEALATEITETVEIRLEHEAHYDWVVFVSQCESDVGALTKYFGKIGGDDEFKVSGIEARQRSTPSCIEEVQQECLERFDATRSSEAILGCLQGATDQLHSGRVPIKQLVERNRVSKPLEGYTQDTQNVAALKRARDQDLAVHPGHRVRGRRRWKDLARAGRIGSRGGRDVRSGLLRDGTRQSRRERSLTVGLDPVGYPSKALGDTGARANSVRGVEGELTNKTSLIEPTKRH